MKDLATFIKKYPHNTDCGDRFVLLVQMAYHRDKSGESLEEFIQTCLDRFGGTIAGALVEYLSQS